MSLLVSQTMSNAKLQNSDCLPCGDRYLAGMAGWLGFVIYVRLSSEVWLRFILYLCIGQIPRHIEINR